VCLALLALQGGIVTSPLWETHSQKEVHPKPHVEESGERHLDMHDEKTCLVCSVRTLASLPAAPAPAIHAVRRADSITTCRHAPPALVASYPRRSRAPPSRLA
jgi:hypothetical protein